MVWCWRNHRELDRWIIVKNPERDSDAFSQLIFYKDVKAVTPSMRKRCFFSKWTGKSRKQIGENEPGHLLHIIKFNLRWIRDLHTPARTTKSLAGYLQEYLHELKAGRFLREDPKSTNHPNEILANRTSSQLQIPLAIRSPHWVYNKASHGAEGNIRNT